MPLNRYDRFVKNQFMYDVHQTLQRENTHLKKKMDGSGFNKFYQENNKGLTSYVVTERIYQYLIYRSLSDRYRMQLEDFSYPNKANRMDITIFKTKPKQDQAIGEIGIEIKKAQMNKSGVFSKNSIADFKSDFNKIKKAKHENKYLLQIVVSDSNKRINEEAIEKQILVTLSGQSLKTHRPELIYSKDFKTHRANDEVSKILLLLWKVVKNN